MALAKGGDAKQLAKGIARHMRLFQITVDKLTAVGFMQSRAL
jgi:hypothetical protein